jgi:hypothetical protein
MSTPGWLQSGLKVTSRSSRRPRRRSAVDRCSFHWVEDGQPLAQPRLVADGAVKSGRYVSGVVDLVVGEGSLGQ